MRLCALYLILTIAIGELNAQTNYEQFIKIVFDDYISGSLFGKLWKFDEFCGDSRDSSAIIKDDLEAELFFNGTKLALLSQINSSIKNTEKTEESLNKVIDDLNYHGIKAIKSVSPACSVDSWGYSDKRQFELSNLPYDNETECKLMIDSLYNSLRIFSKNSILKSSGSELDIIKNQNDQYLLVEAPEVASTNLSLQWEQLNTFGRAPSGSLSWNHIWTGDYDSCVSLPSTRYCFGALKNKNWPQTNREIAYKVGICLPRSCNSNLIKISEEYHRKTDQLIKSNLIENFGLTSKSSYELVDLYCPPAKDSSFRSPFYDVISTVLVIIAVVWFSLTIFATIEPSTNQNNSSSSSSSSLSLLLAYFDLKSSWKRFIKVNNKDGSSSASSASNQLEGINFLKNITMVWLIISHFYMLNLATLSNWQNLRHQMNSPIGCFLLQGQHGVPLFFIISGLLVGYKNLNNKKLNPIKLIFNRYIRLLPMYLLIYAYIKKFGHLINSGPIWDYGVSNESEARQCMMESWLVPILMLANFIPPSSHCILTGWHIANDFQIYLLSPFLIHIYQRSRFKGALVVLFSFIATHLYHVWNFYSTTRYAYRQFVFESFLFGPTVVLGRLAYDYVNPFGRLGTYFLGVALADLLLNNNIIKGKDGINYEMKRGSDKFLTTATKTNTTQNTNTNTNNNCSKQKQIGDSLCAIPEKNVVEQHQESKCLNDELSSNLSTNHNNNNNNNNTSNNHHDQNLQKQPANVQQQQVMLFSSSSSSSLVKEKNKIPVCCQAPSNGDQQAGFKDIVLLLSGLALITFCLSIPVTTTDMKNIFGSSSKFLSYPILRCLCEIGWALIVYAVLAKQSNSLIMSTSLEVDKKLEERNKFVIASFYKQTTKTKTGETRVSNVASGLALACGFMRLSIWDILVKMHYTLILVHFAVVKYVLQSKRHANSFTWIEFNQSLLFIIVMAYLVSMILHLTVETPLNLMISRLMATIEKGRQRDTPKKSTC